MKIGLFGLITIILLIAKIVGILNISWFMVFLPTIIGFCLAVILLIGMIIGAVFLSK